ncbi:MAG: hypothetical protein FJZ57_08195, partial [Chlamydiae bacterium]|nr:hypothetical protein [Chlamydiota bacterium]
MSNIPTGFPVFTVPEGASLQNVFDSTLEQDQVVSEVATRAMFGSAVFQERSLSEAIIHQDPFRLPDVKFLEFLTYLESRSMGSIVSFADAQKETDINELDTEVVASCASLIEIPRQRECAPVYCMTVGLNELYRKIRSQADSVSSIITNGSVEVDQNESVTLCEKAVDTTTASEELFLRERSIAPIHRMTVGINELYQKIRPDVREAPKMYAIPRLLGAGEIPKEFNTSIGLVNVKSILGQGVYGTVYSVEIIARREHGEEVALIQAALKINNWCKQNYNYTLAHQKSLQNEYAIMKHLGRMDQDDVYSISRTIGDVQISVPRYGFFQKLYNSDLYKEVISKGEPLSFQDVYSIAHQLFRALQLFQSVRGGPLIHCDLKPENILIENKEKSKIRIADFGIAKVKHQQNSGHDKDYIVSRFYRAPELVFGRPYGPKIDQWSVACILFEMIATQPLFPAKTTNDLMQMFTRLLGSIPSRMNGGSSSATQADVPAEEFLQQERDHTSSVIKRKLQRVKLELANPGIPSDQVEVI